MARVKLTAPRIEALECPPGTRQVIVWDSDTPGLGVRVTQGAKAFVFQSRFQGATIRMKIGSPDVWPLNSRADRVGAGAQVAQLGAREEARRLQAIIDSGRDPRNVRNETIAADVANRSFDRQQELKVAEVWAVYMEERKPHWGARYYQDHIDRAKPGGLVRKRSKKKTKPAPLAELMEERLINLTNERLERWATKEGGTRAGVARLCLRMVKAFVRWCASTTEYRDAVRADAASGKRLRDRLGTPKRLNTVLQKEQLSAWFEAVRAIPNPVMSAYLQFMLLTGPRPSEPLWLTGEDLSFKWRTISIRDKVEGTRLIGMTPYVHVLLNGLPRRNQWVFSSPTSRSGRLIEAGIAHDKACDAAGLPHLTLQGLRRSFASLCEWIEVPAGISAQIQGHAPQGIREQNYIRRPVDLLRNWHNKIEAWMLAEAGIEFNPSNHPLRVVTTRDAA
jgi:integrase